MRRRLLLLCFTLSLCICSFAIDSGNYLVRNVATGKYWGAANSWGTQASLVSNPEYITWTKLDDGRYHLESQVNSGDEAYYFNGDFMDNDSPIALTIEQQANGYYTISNGEIYYGYDGASAVLGKTETDPTAANVQWEIISVADATVALSNATQTAPMNATFLVADPNFGRNNRHYDAWTFDASNKNNEGDVTNFCVESWHATFMMSQTVTVPNGVYGLTAQGFYSQDGSDNEHLPVFFLNDATRTFPVMTGTENSMSAASVSFSEGRYTTEPVFVNVTDGSLTLGARLESNTTLWCIWDNFTLMYYGTEADYQQMTFDVRFNKKVAEVNSLLATEDVTTEGKRQLNEALSAFGVTNASSPESTQQSVEQQIDAAVAYAKEGLALVENLTVCYNKYGEKVGNAGSSDQTLTGTLAAILSAISGHSYESNSQIEGWIETLTTARKQYFPYEYRYWFDNDERTAHTDLSHSPKWSFDADISNLRETLHTLHFQVSDEEGVLSAPVTRFFVKTINPTANYGRYWFDDAIDQMQTSPQMQGAFDIDVSQLPEGFHILHYQVVGTDGNVSGVVTRLFYKLYMPTLSSWRCWFDNDFSTLVTGTDLDKTILLDVSSLVDGYHVLHIQADGGKGVASTPITRPFIKTPQVVGVDHLTCLCMIDDQLYKQEQVSANGGVVEWKFDVSSLSQGFHRVFIQVVTPSGAATSAYQSFFMRETTSAEFAQMKCVYAIDGAEFFVEAGEVAKGTFHFDLDVSALDDGLHRITYMLSNGLGVSTKAQTQFFVKTPLGGNGITAYWYWLNDQADSNATKVQLAERQDPFSLISLLPVESQSLRSSLFQFRIEQDKPVVYAKNDIHIRFYDAAGRFTDATKQFVDESVRQEVTDVTLLNPGEHKTISSPEENAIQWFKFYSEEGDTVTFKTDQAASIQVFSPEGKEIYSASGSRSVKNGGCHTWIDGTYYVALHDVTGSRPNISLDFTHLAKHDVVDYDVAVVGNGGCSTITFKGNGFKDLYAVDFINAANDSIHAFSIGHESDGTTSVTADFTDAALGKYTALFHFTEGKKYVYDAITVEDAKPIDLATEVTFPRSFGHVVTYTCKITNSGNMTAYAVPVYTWLKSKTLNGIYHIDYDGLDLANIFDGVVTDSLSESEIAELRARSEALGDDHHFLKFWAEDEDHPGDSVFVRSNYFFTNIAPNETKVLRLTISTREVDTYAYFTVPEDWPSYQVAQVEGVAGARARFRAPSMKDRYCCIRNKVECVANLVADGTSIANEILQYAPDLTTQMAAAAADCVASGVSKIISTAGTVMCDDNSVEKNFWDKVHAALDGTSTTGMITSCISKLPLPWKKIKAIFDAIGKGAGGASMAFGLGVDMADCAIAFTSKIPGCPPIPPGGGGAQGGKSHDPNEIYGYLAESGSKYMTDEVEKVNYRIEFENDTVFATRSAMVVEIRDTLDSKLFDLSSYAPTGIKIGEKVEYLDGEPNFVRTIDMRPEINGLVEVEGKYDAKKGVMTWLFTSIDPMTMEPTNDPMDGFLPVNTNGQGIGEMSYDIKLKQKMVEGTNIQNRASIVFDINEPILTPTWTNIVDATAPESHVTDVQMLNDSTASVSIEASDELSGPWRYNVYVQYGSGAWFKAAENVPVDTTASVKVYEGIDHGFYVVVTDSAGNVEQKVAEREFTFEVFGSQMDTDTQIELAEGWNWMSHNQQEPLPVSALKPAGSRMVGQVEELIEDTRFGWMGDLEELQPTQMYKLQMDQPLTVQLSGRLFNASFRCIPLYQGWNWMGYPMANTMAPAEALSKFEAEEGDMLIGQDGLSTYSEGQWQGTLTTMNPGEGYMFFSQSDKNLFLNASAQASSRRAETERNRVNSAELPDGWSVDKHKYPNVMGMIGQLWHGSMHEDVSGWVLAAFCGNECRGIGKPVGEVMMMNVYGSGGEQIGFRVMNKETGEVLGVSNQETFHPEVLGTMAQPYQLTMGEPTGIKSVSESSLPTAIYDLMGRRLQPSTPLGKGIYVVTDSENKTIQKVIRK